MFSSFPCLTRPEEEEEGKEKVNIDLLSLTSIGGFFLLVRL